MLMLGVVAVILNGRMLEIDGMLGVEAVLLNCRMLEAVNARGRAGSASRIPHLASHFFGSLGLKRAATRLPRTYDRSLQRNVRAA